MISSNGLIIIEMVSSETVDSKLQETDETDRYR